MTPLKCSRCKAVLVLDETDEDELHNATFIGWQFSLWFDTETLCPSCLKHKDSYNNENIENL